MTLKEYFLKTNKLIIYKFYAQFFAKPLKYDNITRKEMYHQIINLYKKNPLIIINLCSMEEISILKSIISENNIRHTGYIEYLCYQNLLNNFLLMEDKKELFIPTDIINYIKMALNLFDELTYSNQDIEISALIGLSRIYNCLPVNDLIPILAKYHINPDLCKGCGLCKRNCPVGAISESGDKRVIDANACISCGTCAAECPAEAIVEE